MQDIPKIDPDIFRFTVTSLMGALASQFKVNTASSEHMRESVDSMSNMAVLMAQSVLSKTEGAGVLVIGEGHPVLAALTGFSAMNAEIGDLLRPELAEGELGQAAAALVTDNPCLWFLDEIGIPMPGSDDVVELGRPLLLCKAASLLLLEAVRIEQAEAAAASDGALLAQGIEALADGTLVPPAADVETDAPTLN